MGFSYVFKKKTKVNGIIKHLGLHKWWLEELTDSEREIILSRYQPLGAGGNSIIEGEIYSTCTTLNFLGGLAGWFSSPDVRSLAYKIIEKAESLIDASSNPLDIHFLYGTKLEIKYKDRGLVPNGLEEAVKACEQQIDCAPQAAKEFRKQYGDALPNHQGYQQLAIVLEKQKNFSGAISICEQAMKQGWAGGWEKRIERCSKRLKT